MFNNKEYQKKYYLEHKEEHALRGRIWKKKNVDKVKKKYLENIDHIKKRDKTRYDLKREDILKQKKEYYIRNKEIILKKYKKWSEKNKEKISIQKRDYRIKNIDAIREKDKKYHKIKVSNNPLYRLITNSRKRLNIHLKSRNLTKKCKFSEYVGCNTKELRMYLESKFMHGMNWENYGKWHIDHITPLASARSEEEIYKLLHFSNLQPLWAIDNIRKGSKIISNK